jgi:hypothetical protein
MSNHIRPLRRFRTAALVAGALAATLAACNIDTPDLGDDDEGQKKPGSGSGGATGLASGAGGAAGGMAGSGGGGAQGGAGASGGQGGGGPSPQEVCEVGCANVYYCELCLVDENQQCVDEATCVQSCLADTALQETMYCAATVETCEELMQCGG